MNVHFCWRCGTLLFLPHPPPRTALRVRAWVEQGPRQGQGQAGAGPWSGSGRGKGIGRQQCEGRRGPGVRGSDVVRAAPCRMQGLVLLEHVHLDVATAYMQFCMRLPSLMRRVGVHRCKKGATAPGARAWAGTGWGVSAGAVPGKRCLVPLCLGTWGLGDGVEHSSEGQVPRRLLQNRVCIAEWPVIRTASERGRWTEARGGARRRKASGNLQTRTDQTYPRLSHQHIGRLWFPV